MFKTYEIEKMILIENVTLFCKTGISLVFWYVYRHIESYILRKTLLSQNKIKELYVINSNR